LLSKVKHRSYRAVFFKNKYYQTIKEENKMQKQTNRVVIKEPGFGSCQFSLTGSSPLVQNRFKGVTEKELIQQQSSVTKIKGQHKPRDFDAEWKDAMYYIERNEQDIYKSRFGLHAAGLRNALIRACSIVGIEMTKARMSLFVVQDGIDELKGEPLIEVFGKPEQHIMRSVISMGTTTLSCRAMFKEWEIRPTLKWDADQFDLQSVTNLLVRVGIQVGLGEGRNSSKKSSGLGWGCFDVTEIGGVDVSTNKIAV
jgi:hypothetical protein|tara:strand:+ start:1358 stop:2119 length:762 start_codon:yes stop_codon:yes gene_type:complete